MNHHYTREERERLANVESIDYLPPNSEVYRRWLAGQPHRWPCFLIWLTQLRGAAYRQCRAKGWSVDMM